MKCPRDGTELQTVDVSGIELDKCHHCDGLWLDHGELKTIRSMPLDEIEEQLEQKYGNPKVTPGGVDAYMRCPRCVDAPLSRHHISYFHQPVEVDRCQQCHGIWLDDKELDALLTDRKQMDKELGNKSVFAVLQQFMKGFTGSG